MDGLIALALSKKYADAVGEKVAREGFHVEVESDRSILETTGQEKVFYFLPKDVSKPDDGYDEFIWTADQSWEQVGVTDVDLSAYALKATSLAGYGIEDAYTKTEINSMIGDVNTALQQLVTDFSEV